MNNEQHRALRAQGKKYCPCCKEVKSLDDFANHSERGRQSTCRGCRAAYLRARYKAGKRGPKRVEELKRQRYIAGWEEGSEDSR